MKRQQKEDNDALQWLFLETLSEDFVQQTGFGLYAHINPLDAHRVYAEFQENPAPMAHFARDYVRSYL